MQLLVDELGDRAYLGTLAADSSNVVDLVADLYNVRVYYFWSSLANSSNNIFSIVTYMQRISQRIVFAPENVPGLSIKVRPTECPGT